MRDRNEKPLSSNSITMAPATTYEKQNGNRCNGEVIIQNGSQSYDTNPAIMPQQRHRRFGHVMPLMVSHMKDHKIVEFPMVDTDSRSAIINELPFSSSTLLKNSSRKSTKLTQKQNPVEDNEDFEQDSLENIADHIEHMYVSPNQQQQTSKEEPKTSVINNPSISSSNETKYSRKLPTTPIDEIPTIASEELPKTTKKRRKFSLPSSPFNLRKTSRHKFKRNANSLRDRLRQSFHHRTPVYDAEQDLFPEEREHRYYQGAKRRGRRGAVISLEVNQTVSLVKSQGSDDHFLEFSFVPPNKSEMT